MLITHLPNIRYLTGFTGSAALLVVRADATVLISDFRYAAQAPVEVSSVAAVEIDLRSGWERLGTVLQAAAGFPNITGWPDRTMAWSASTPRPAACSSSNPRSISQSCAEGRRKIGTSRPMKRASSANHGLSSAGPRAVE